MEAARRAKYLNALGVVQYRRRLLAVASPAPARESVAAQTEIAPGHKIAPPDTEKSSAAKIAGRFEKPIAVDDPVRVPERAKSDLVEDSQGLKNDSPAFGFNLLVWRSAKILVLEFSVLESEEIDLKHRLANNMLKALWPLEFKGVEVYQHSWPMPGVAADITSATGWLNSLVSGHLHHESKTPIWVMGELGLKMLFPEQSGVSENLSRLIGTRTRHEKLGVDLLISPGLKHISASATAKAQTWQLLKPVRQIIY